LNNLDKAGLLIKIMGWIGVAVFSGLITFAIFFILSGGSGYSVDSLLFVVLLPVAALILAISILHLKAASAIRKGENWGKVTGVVLAIISLPGFPIGTIFGVITLFYLKKGWGEMLDDT